MIHQFMTSLRDTDHKIIVLPIVFVLLWVWHLLGDILYVHIGMNSNNSLADIIILLSVGVCLYVCNVCDVFVCVGPAILVNLCNMVPHMQLDL